MYECFPCMYVCASCVCPFSRRPEGTVDLLQEPSLQPLLFLSFFCSPGWCGIHDVVLITQPRLTTNLQQSYFILLRTRIKVLSYTQIIFKSFFLLVFVYICVCTCTVYVVCGVRTWMLMARSGHSTRCIPLLPPPYCLKTRFLSEPVSQGALRISLSLLPSAEVTGECSHS